jgi:hypothetical protein
MEKETRSALVNDSAALTAYGPEAGDTDVRFGLPPRDVALDQAIADVIAAWQALDAVLDSVD